GDEESLVRKGKCAKLCLRTLRTWAAWNLFDDALLWQLEALLAPYDAEHKSLLEHKHARLDGFKY
ncbi:MAG: hypothetical protein MHM6MM_006331, partial [Cercozoa sp. M6MM]